MKKAIFAVLCGLTLLGAGCVRTVTERSTGGVPFVKDSVQGKYERSVDQVFEAAKEVVKYNGALSTESIIHSATNSVKTVEGTVNQCKVWVRVEAMDPKITGVVVQTRTKGGGADLDLAHELEKQIAVKLAR